jgi:uncharacterized protein
MRAVAEGASLDGPALALALLLTSHLVIGQPIVGRWSAHRLRQTLRTDRRARIRRYRRTMLLEWTLFATAIAVTIAAPGLDLADLGVQWPRASPYTAVGVVGLVASVAMLAGLRLRVDRGVPVRASPEVTALLPRTPVERRAFTAVAITAGVCEETLYRGFLLAVVAAVAGDLPGPRLAALSALAFGLAHLYQGTLGVLSATILGGCLAVLFLGSGSLLLPVLYHMLVDLRLLVLAVGQRGRPRHRA